MKVKMRTISTNHNPKPLRTETFTGELVTEPRVGNRLVVIGRGLNDRRAQRIVETSKIVHITPINEKSTNYHTENSVYRITKVQK